MLKKLNIFLIIGVTVVAFLGMSFLMAKKVTIGHQLMSNPWKYAIDQGWFEKETGYDIEWRKFSSGGAVINAMASGDVHIAVAGSSPIAAGVSRGVDMKLFWIVEDIAAAEALVVRNGSGISAPQDLKGKRLGVPFVSTTHFHTLFALEQFGIKPSQLKILNLQGSDITTAWKTGRIDAAFIWDPALGEIKKTGKVLITSGVLSSWGKATFDGMVVHGDFEKKNKKFMKDFVKVMARADKLYLDDPKSWTPKSKYVKSIIKLVGGDPNVVPETLALYKFLTPKEQASSAWLGGGAKGGAAQALKFTSEFLKSEKKIDKVQRDYGKFVIDDYAKANM